MKWNWQQKDWPRFTYDAKALVQMEKQFLQESGLLWGAFSHLTPEDGIQIRIDMIREEAFKTSEIEGELLNRDSLQSSIRRQFGLQGGKKKIPPAEQGIVELMMDLHHHYDQELTQETLFHWHRLITKGRTDLRDIGQYRTHDEPMQVVSGYAGHEKVHFEAPPSSRMKKEMSAFLTWCKQTQTGGKEELPSLVHASLAHLYFVSIHPFEDGNGRVARALSEKILASSIGQPTLIGLSQMIERKKKAYYDALEEANKKNEVTPWLLYFADVILQAQEATRKIVHFTIQKAKLYARLKDKLNPRQEKALNRMFAEGIDGFKGGLSAENYISITDAPRATATRDLQDLVAMGALKRTGELRYTRYWLAISP